MWTDDWYADTFVPFCGNIHPTQVFIGFDFLGGGGMLQTLSHESGTIKVGRDDSQHPMKTPPTVPLTPHTHTPSDLEAWRGRSRLGRASFEHFADYTHFSLFSSPLPFFNRKAKLLIHSSLGMSADSHLMCCPSTKTEWGSSCIDVVYVIWRLPTQSTHTHMHAHRHTPLPPNSNIHYRKAWLRWNLSLPSLAPTCRELPDAHAIKAEKLSRFASVRLQPLIVPDRLETGNSTALLIKWGFSRRPN